MKLLNKTQRKAVRCINCKNKIDEIGYCQKCGLLTGNIVVEDKEKIRKSNLEILFPDVLVKASLPALENSISNFLRLKTDKRPSYRETLFCFCFYYYSVSISIQMKTGREDILKNDLKNKYIDLTILYLQKHFGNSFLNDISTSHLNDEFDKLLFMFVQTFSEINSPIQQALELSNMVYHEANLARGLPILSFCIPRLSGAFKSFAHMYLAEQSDFVFPAD